MFDTIFWLNVIRMVLILLIPLIPSLVVAKFLPLTSAEAGGLFQGMQIKLAGGGALYFILLLAAWKMIPSPQPPATDQAVAWTVTGAIGMQPLKTGDDPPDALTVVAVTCKPTWVPTGADSFALTIAQQKINGVPSFPSLIFTADKYRAQTIKLEDASKVEKDEANRVLNIKEPILLNPMPTATGPVARVTAQEIH